MKNLKRALSLVLSTAMLLGMMVVGSGASFNDVDKADNVEAIEVLAAVGIMEGDGNGFNPDALVTRNEMAVVMSNLMDYRVASYAGTSPFVDVPDWAEPYVAACYTNGITAGVSADVFGGDMKVTTAQAALMLMKALGYFQYQSDFEDDWMFATTRQAAKIELFDGVEAGVKEAMTRNDLAQLVLNTLEAGMVEPDNDITKVEAGDVKVETGKITYYFVTSQKDYANQIGKTESANSLNGVSGKIVELGEKLYNGNLQKNPNVTDAFGRPATNWTYKSTSIGTFAADPIATYTAKVSKATLYDLVGSSVVDDLVFQGSALGSDAEDDLVVYVDGVIQTGKSVSDYFARNSSAGGASGKGVVTEVYLDNDGNVTIVYINTYLMQATNDYNENKGTINVTVETSPAPMAVNALDIDDFAAIADFAEDDYILYTASNKNGTGWAVKSVAKAEIVTGVVDAYSDESWVTLDGTKYEYNKWIEGDDMWDGVDDDNATGSAATDYVVSDTAAIVVDKYGYVIYVDDASISVGNYVYIAAAATSSSLQTKDIADAIFTDGTREEITVKALYERNTSPLYALSTTATDISQLSDKTDVAGWYAYSKDSNGKYTLKEAKTSEIIGEQTTTNIKSGKAAISNVGVANKNTIFVVKQSDGAENVFVYTGITNVPNVDNATIYAMQAKDISGNKLSLVFAEAAKNDIDNASTDSALYVLKQDHQYIDTVDNVDIYVWKVILDGVETKIETKESGWTAGMYVDYSMDSDGYYEIGTPFANDDDTLKTNIPDFAGSKVITLSGDTLTIAGVDYLVDDETVINLVMAPAGNKGGTTLKTEIMTDDSASYELGLGISANALEGLFDGYYIRGSVYAVYADDKADTDLLSSLYIVINGVRAI